MTDLMWAGVAIGVVFAGAIVLTSGGRAILLPVLLVVGIAGLAAVVQAQREQQRQAQSAATSMSYDNMVAELSNRPARRAQPLVNLRPPSPFLGTPTGAAAPPAVRIFSRQGATNAS